MLDEFVIILDDKQIRCPAYPEDCDYVRITDLEGNEVVYWHWNEWQEEPQEVMGAILAVVGNPIEDAAIRVINLKMNTIQTLHKTLAKVFGEPDTEEDEPDETNMA